MEGDQNSFVTIVKLWSFHRSLLQDPWTSFFSSLFFKGNKVANNIQSDFNNSFDISGYSSQFHDSLGGQANSSDASLSGNSSNGPILSQEQYIQLVALLSQFNVDTESHTGDSGGASSSSNAFVAANLPMD